MKEQRFAAALYSILVVCSLWIYSLIFNFLETLFLEQIYHATESKERKDSQVH